MAICKVCGIWIDEFGRCGCNTVPSKQCSKCKEDKPVTQFSTSKQHPDGKYPYCNACHSLYVREHSTGSRAAYMRQWQKDNPDKLLAIRKRTKDHIAARNKVKKAVQYGKMPPAGELECAVHGTNCKGRASEYHHSDYSNPLDVTPVCEPCHKEIHRKYQTESAP